jgi:hypothetical protein
MAASTQSGYMDLDRRPILVLDHDVHRRYRDLDLVIDHVLGSYGDSLDENGLADMVDDIMSVEVDGKLGSRTVMPLPLFFTGKVTKVVRDKLTNNITKFWVQMDGGPSETFVVDANTTFPQGDAIEKKLVSVTYTEVQGSDNLASEVRIQ